MDDLWSTPRPSFFSVRPVADQLGGSVDSRGISWSSRSRRELMEVLGLKGLSHEDLSNHSCLDLLKAHEARFARDKTLETALLTGIPKKSIIGPVNYRPLKVLGSPGLTMEPPKYRTNIVRTRVAIPTQLRTVEKLLEPKSMGLPDTTYMGPKLSEDLR